MIVRKYGRRGRGLTSSYSGTDSFSDVVSDSPPQECAKDVYNFTFSSQESARCNWSDPYNFNSSQESKQLAILPPRNSGDYPDLDNGIWKTKKLKVVDVDSEPYSCSLSQESKDFGVLAISDSGFEKPNKVKKVGFYPYEYYSSEELEELSVLPPRKERKDTSVFEFSEDGDIWKPNKFKNVDSDSCGLYSSQELVELENSQPKKLNCWEYDGVSRRSKNDRRENGVLQKKKKKNKNKMKLEDPGSSDAVITTTLMETQEFGEMMEHVDEVNFSLDGLKKGQPVGVRRGSLSSLLSICKTAQQRRLLRVHGMAKTIIDSVLGLSFDDPTSNLAAASLCYILTSDGQDENLLDSPNCIRFLIRMLKPFSSTAANEKVHSIGSKLLGMSKNTSFSKDSAKEDSSSAAITKKVQEILVNCKEMKPRDESDSRMEEPEMNPKWISLLTMEKACLSTISIEDTSGNVRKSGGNFKEKLRELGGLDAVFEVARKCHSMMEEWLLMSPNFVLDLKDITGLESLLVVLKCLKVMENATFLSKDNQSHLLGMKGNFDGKRAPRSFTKLILSFVKILSGVSLSSRYEKLCGASNQSSDSGDFYSMECTVSQNRFDESRSNKFPDFSQTGIFKSSLKPNDVSSDRWSLKIGVESSTAELNSRTCGTSNSIIQISRDSSEPAFVGNGKLVSTDVGDMEYSQDPFAFDEDDFEPSKWDLLSGNVNKSPSQESRATKSDYIGGNDSVCASSQQESSNFEYHNSREASSSTVDEEKSTLLSDCLLTAVKVLMNLTNDNPEGCRQIAACGGLEILASLIVGHFPSFSSTLPQLRCTSLLPKSSSSIDKQSNSRLTDQELDFLVAILGLLVNLVEKDGRNRSRLAAATISVPIVEGLCVKEERSVIPLLCSIFLANQGAGEAAEDGKQLSWDDEESILLGEKEAEKMIVEAYAALLLAFLSTESKSIRDAIADCLPEKNLKILVPVMERFVEFHFTLNVISPETHKTVLEVMESCRIP